GGAGGRAHRQPGALGPDRPALGDRGRRARDRLQDLTTSAGDGGGDPRDLPRSACRLRRRDRGDLSQEAGTRRAALDRWSAPHDRERRALAGSGVSFDFTNGYNEFLRVMLSAEGSCAQALALTKLRGLP